jgi:hypothetical protein
MSNIEAFRPKAVECSSTQQKESSFFIGNQTDADQPLDKKKSNTLGSNPQGQGQASLKKKCKSCNKKITLSNEFTCKCKGTFCGKHKYPDMHECTFDHRAEW